MPHRPLVTLIAWQIARSTGAPRTLQLASPSFDVSFQEIFATLCAGGELVIAPDSARRDPRELLALLAGERIERLFRPYVALQPRAAAAAAAPLHLPSLREVITAGEQLHVTPSIAAFFGRAAGAALYNQYGPTEAHVVTEHALAAGARAWPALPPIGRPIANATAHVLDDRLRPVPVGVPGELWLGGVAPARGYLGRPAATAERFRPDPLGAPGARIYRTGDVARRLPGGEIQFLGRADDQIKVRGYRVEPGEVEAAIASHPAVRDVAVVARREPGQADGAPARLVAHVVARSAVSASDLRRHLEGALPEPMIPSIFALTDALPLTPSGKIDRRALAERPIELAADGEPRVAPRTRTERELARIWSEVLGVSPIGVHDDFFAIGGHSLLATQAISRMRDALGLDLPLRRFFEARTIAAVARSVAAEGLDLGDGDAAELLAEVERLSPEEAAALLERDA
ncbi:MAG: non-ribosomal peptide synthetase [Polyangiaceae bacterium]|nr:non-ribosomal peptide synthetase [Polyangiaceae bacterium]